MKFAELVEIFLFFIFVGVQMLYAKPNRPGIYCKDFRDYLRVAKEYT